MVSFYLLFKLSINYTSYFFLTQEFAVQITFRQKWNDPRLRFDDYKGSN